MLVGQRIEMATRAPAPRPSTATRRASADLSSAKPPVLKEGLEALDINNANTLLFGDFLRKTILSAVKGPKAGSREIVGRAFRHLHKGQVSVGVCA